MAKNVFEESEERQRSPLLGEKIITSVVERSGYVIAAAILLVVILVMTTDIRFITAQSVADFSATFFVLMFCSYGMYMNMYRNGMISGERLKEYKDVCKRYDEVRDKIKSADVYKRLADFCREYVDNDRRARIEEALSFSGVSYDEFLRYQHLGRAALKAEGLCDTQIRRIRSAKRIRPIKLTPAMLYKQGKGATRFKALHTPPSERRKRDSIFKFITNALSYGMTGFIAFEMFSDPSFKTLCTVAFKLLMIGYTGYSGYVRGYDNIVTDTVLYINDQIDLLEQFERREERICATESESTL